MPSGGLAPSSTSITLRRLDRCRSDSEPCCLLSYPQCAKWCPITHPHSSPDERDGTVPASFELISRVRVAKSPCRLLGEWMQNLAGDGRTPCPSHLTKLLIRARMRPLKCCFQSFTAILFRLSRFFASAFDSASGRLHVSACKIIFFATSARFICFTRGGSDSLRRQSHPK